MVKVKLGDEVKDPITGYEGIACARITYLQGCDRIGIQAPAMKAKDKLTEVPELYYVDEPQLVITKPFKPVKKTKRTNNGGASGFEPSHKR